MHAHSFRRIVCFAVIAAFVWQAPVVGAARAGMVTTETVLQAERSAPAGAEAAGRDRLQAFLRRQDVRAQLVALGVDPAEAAARVENLSDAEVAPLVAQIDSLPAGGTVCGNSSSDQNRCLKLGLVILYVVAFLLVAGAVWLVYKGVSAVAEDDEPPSQAALPRVVKANTAEPTISPDGSE